MTASLSSKMNNKAGMNSLEVDMKLATWGAEGFSKHQNVTMVMLVCLPLKLLLVSCASKELKHTP